MQNVNLKADQLFVNVREAILVIPTPTVSEILVLPILVVSLVIFANKGISYQIVEILGANAICENNGNAAICKCPPENIGDPYVSCT